MTMEADFTGHRVKMVDGQVRTTDVTDNALLSALLTVPRESFVDEGRRDLAFIDEDLELVPASANAPARYMMRASPLAKLVQLAAVKPTDRVLDVGCGSGYSSAVLARLAASVVALESDPALAAKASTILASLGATGVEVVCGSLPEGVPTHAPYDVILMGGSVELVPSALLAQLGEGGRLVTFEGAGLSGVARLYVNSNGGVSGRTAFNAAAKPLPGFARPQSFVF